MIHHTLRALRKRRKISQLELALSIGVSQQAVSKWERGIAEPSIEYINLLADFYGVSAGYITGHTSDDLTAKMENLLKQLAPDQVAILYETGLKMLEDTESKGRTNKETR